MSHRCFLIIVWFMVLLTAGYITTLMYLSGVKRNEWKVECVKTGGILTEKNTWGLEWRAVCERKVKDGI